MGAMPHGLAMDPQEGLLFVSDSGSNTSSVIDMKTNRTVQTLPVGTQPQGVVVNLLNGWVYSVNQGSNTVTVLTPQSAGRH